MAVDVVARRTRQHLIAFLAVIFSNRWQVRFPLCFLLQEQYFLGLLAGILVIVLLVCKQECSLRIFYISVVFSHPIDLFCFWKLKHDSFWLIDIKLYGFVLAWWWLWRWSIHLIVNTWTSLRHSKHLKSQLMGLVSGLTYDLRLVCAPTGLVHSYVKSGL
jgi:hypothetical protein